MKDKDNDKLRMYRKQKWIVNMKEKKKNWREGLGNIKWSETTSDMLGGKIEKKKFQTLSLQSWMGEKKKKKKKKNKWDQDWPVLTALESHIKNLPRMDGTDFLRIGKILSHWRCVAVLSVRCRRNPRTKCERDALHKDSAPWVGG